MPPHNPDTPTKIPPGTGTEAATPDYIPPDTADTPRFRAAGYRYEIGDLIARGGMGAVYRGRDAAFKRQVAIKLLLHDHGADSPAGRRFFGEARIAGQLQHPGIPPIYDIGTLPDGRPFLAMKLIKGETLDALIKSRRPLNVAAVFEGICQAVGYAHAHRVIHWDLKPANVMVGAFAEVQVMDWGLARVLDADPAVPASRADTGPLTAIETDRDDTAHTREGAVVGTLNYMPPEQAHYTRADVDPRSDVFGLGGILCAMLTGTHVYTGGSETELRLKAVKCETGPAFARLDGCGADPKLVALCKRCLAERKEDRPADGNAMVAEVAALRAAADERAKQAETDRATAAVRAKQAETDRATAAVRAEEEAKRRVIEAATSRRRLRVLSWAAAAVFTALLAVAAGTTWQAHQAQRSRDSQASERTDSRQLEADRRRDLQAFERTELQTGEIHAQLEVLKHLGLVDRAERNFPAAVARFEKALAVADGFAKPEFLPKSGMNYMI